MYKGKFLKKSYYTINRNINSKKMRRYNFSRFLRKHKKTNGHTGKNIRGRRKEERKLYHATNSCYQKGKGKLGIEIRT